MLRVSNAWSATTHFETLLTHPLLLCASLSLSLPIHDICNLSRCFKNSLMVVSHLCSVAAILMIVAELRITACLTPFAFLKSWLGRGMFYVFVGLNVLVINGGDNAGLSALGAALIVAGVASVLTTCTWLPEDLEEKELRAQQAANHAARYAPQSPAAQNTEVAQPQAAAVAAPHAVKEEDPFAAYTRSQAEKANAAPQLASLDDGVRSPTSPSSIEISASTGNTAPAKAGPSGANGDVVSATVGTKSPRNGKDPNPFDVDLDS